VKTRLPRGQDGARGAGAVESLGDAVLPDGYESRPLAGGMKDANSEQRVQCLAVTPDVALVRGEKCLAAFCMSGREVLNVHQVVTADQFGDS